MLPPESPSSRVPPAELLRLLGERLARADGSRIALLAIALSPSERLLAVGRGRTVRTVLVEVGRRVDAILRDTDRYAFASREELWVLLPDLPSESLAELAGRTLLDHLRQPIAMPASQDAPSAIQLQPSLGVAWTAATGGIDALSILSVATDASATCHRHAAQRVVVRRVRTSRDNLAARKKAEGDLMRALDANELEVHFQPQLDLRIGECRSAEALIRWRREDGGAANPEAIVALCEQRELILQLTRFTLNTALRRVSEWATRGLDLSVAVNLSAATLPEPTLPMMVSQALETWSVPASRLTLELTESALIRNQRVAGEAMKQLHRLGCRLSIDDFGTGYSPYAYLRQFSFNELKIDRSFVQNVQSDAASLRVVRSLVELAHAFGMDAVAEGVEDGASADTLRELGCDLAQGWHVSAALRADELALWCLARRDEANERRGPAAQRQLA